jgi:hypothetical protein
MVKRLKHLLREAPSRSPSPKSLAIAWARLGEKDRALEWLWREYAERSEALLYMKVDPRYDCLRDDQRFVDLPRQMLSLLNSSARCSVRSLSESRAICFILPRKSLVTLA